jgi:hypothetical protein
MILGPAVYSSERGTDAPDDMGEKEESQLRSGIILNLDPSHSRGCHNSSNPKHLEIPRLRRQDLHLLHNPQQALRRKLDPLALLYYF